MRNLILGLARPLLRPLRGDERGVIGVLVAMLLGAGVLTGMGAMVIDVGQLYQERAELQNGADAAALAVAKSCATGTCAPTLSAQYANGNASALTGKTAASVVCGSGTLGACPASTGALIDCPAAPGGGASYVDVRTSTKLSGGSTLLPPVFAKTLLGNGSYQGSAVKACAQAEWGAPTAATVTAFTISACEWDQATALGTIYAQAPPYPPNSAPLPSLDRVIKLRSGSGGGCSTEQGGADAPGSFGWTADPASTCSLAVGTGSNYGSKPGAAVSQACKTVLSADQTKRTLIFVPVYISVIGNGANATYSLKGFAAFVVTGYSLPGFSVSDWLNPSNNCSGSSQCVNGYFTQGLIPYTSSLGGNYLGTSALRLTG